MNSTLARRILPTSLALGLLADWLFRGEESRAGFTVWCLAALAAALLIGRKAEDASQLKERHVLIAVACVLALTLVLREAEMLLALNGFAMLVALLLVGWRALGRPLSALEPRDALIGGLAAATSVVGGAPTLMMRDSDATHLGENIRANYKTFGIGAVVALPILLMATGLLAAADPLFAGFLDEAGLLFDTALAEHLVLVLAVSWFAAGALRGSLVPLAVDGSSFRKEWNLPFSTFLPALGGLTLLLAAWIGLQVRVLYGGADYVLQTSGVTVAEYARRGFFELIVLAGIVLAVLLVTDDLLQRGGAAARRSFHAIGALLVGLVGAVLVSAVLRLSLYLRHFGLTTDRVLALAVLVWVAAVLCWFALTVLRGNRAGFAPGVLIVSACWLALLNVANPEAWIVRTNVARAERGLEFDVSYHARLSADALPALRAASTRLDEATATQLSTAIDEHWARSNSYRAGDWRNWTLPYLLSGRAQ